MIGISRGVPRRIAPGYRVFRDLAPGPWFNSVGVDEYCYRYRTEILGRLNPKVVADRLTRIAEGRTPVLVCYERPDSGQWCHRAMVAEWLAGALGCAVPEFGYEHLAQQDHPLLPPSLRRA
jgi:hypothetical protein